MKNLRTKLSYTLYILLCLVILSGCNKDNEDEYVLKTIKVELVNGSTKVVRYKIPSYATLSIHSFRGSYRLSTWKYCLGVAKCEITLMNGVVYYEVID